MDVSIRARQLQRANPHEWMPLPERDKRFNPRPPITAGESTTRPQFVSMRMFQSAPANYSGRILCSSAPDQAALRVSIRARQLQRANHVQP